MKKLVKQKIGGTKNLGERRKSQKSVGKKSGVTKWGKITIKYVQKKYKSVQIWLRSNIVAFKYGCVQIWSHSNTVAFKYGCVHIWLRSNMVAFKYGCVQNLNIGHSTS